MRIKIDEQGSLCIARGRKQAWRKQYCPHSNGERLCGHWCPLFGEPDSSESTIDGIPVFVKLQLCKAIITVRGEGFMDERG